MISDDTTVEFCVNNVDFDTRTALLEADIAFHQQHCLRRCGVCHERPFVVQDGELVELGSHESLLGEGQNE